MGLRRRVKVNIIKRFLRLAFSCAPLFSSKICWGLIGRNLLWGSTRSFAIGLVLTLPTIFPRSILHFVYSSHVFESTLHAQYQPHQNSSLKVPALPNKDFRFFFWFPLFRREFILPKTFFSPGLNVRRLSQAMA